MKTAFSLALIVAFANAADSADIMGDLPDAPPFTTKTYSGYLDVTATKRLHYVFAESETDPANDPVVIWFNGGPGCSSLLAFMQENGPLKIDDGVDFIDVNPYPWNNRANMLWIESPAGVGWSVGETTEDLSTNDMTQSTDALIALKSWYAKFPEYLPNELYVSGESYAGIYVPYLTW
jgi:cathepsin A (carboxypeptidase C)